MKNYFLKIYKYSNKSQLYYEDVFLRVIKKDTELISLFSVCLMLINQNTYTEIYLISEMSLECYDEHTQSSLGPNKRCYLSYALSRDFTLL